VHSDEVSIAGGAGTLQAMVETPASFDRCAVLCHPHPLYGGTMDNKVITTLARALHECDIATVRFNFRGVGESQGAFAQGEGETDDASAVARWAATRWPGREQLAAGFSFGGIIALRLALTTPMRALITVAPAIHAFDPISQSPACPWTIIQGDVDDVVDPTAVGAWAQGLNPAPHLVALAGVGHFFHGRLADLRGAVIDAIRNG
jgi:alpha/beta superfamily hydrolase